MRANARRALTTAALGLLLLAAGAPVYARSWDLGEAWRWTRYGAADGLPGETITAIAQTTSGETWVSSGGGVAWFDGWQWHPVDSPGGPAAEGAILVPDGDRILAVQGLRLFRSAGHRLEPVPVSVGGLPLDVRGAAPVADPGVGTGILVMARVER